MFHSLSPLERVVVIIISACESQPKSSGESNVKGRVRKADRCEGTVREAERVMITLYAPLWKSPLSHESPLFT